MIDFATLVHSKSQFLANKKSKNQNLGGKRIAVTARIKIAVAVLALLLCFLLKFSNLWIGNYAYRIHSFSKTKNLGYFRVRVYGK